MKKDIIHNLIKEVAKNDYLALANKVENITFENAFKELNGFNLNVNFNTCKGELISHSLKFDFNFGHLNGKIFKDSKGMCDIYECFDFCMDDISSPIATMVIAYDGDVELYVLKVYY